MIYDKHGCMGAVEVKWRWELGRVTEHRTVTGLTYYYQAGVAGPPNSKKRKRAVSTEKDEEKKAAKIDEIQRRLNPFDVKVTKLKHDVGGRRLKGITGCPAQSKQAGLEQVRRAQCAKLCAGACELTFLCCYCSERRRC